MLPCLSLFFLLLLLLLLTCYEDDFLVPDWRVTWTWRAAALHKRSMDGESRYEKEGGERLCPVVGRARAMSAADKREKRAPVKVEGCLPKLGCSIWIPLCLHTSTCTYSGVRLLPEMGYHVAVLHLNWHYAPVTYISFAQPKKIKVLFQHYSNTTYFYTRIYSRINRP